MEYLVKILIKIERKIEDFYNILLNLEYTDEDYDEFEISKSIKALILEEEKILNELISKENIDDVITYIIDKVKLPDDEKINIYPFMQISLNYALNAETYPYFRILAHLMHEKNNHKPLILEEFGEINHNIFNDLETDILYRSLCDKALELKENKRDLSKKIKEYAYYSLIASKELEIDILNGDMLPSEFAINPIPLIIDYDLINKLNFVNKYSIDEKTIEKDEFDIMYRVTLVNRLKKIYPYLINSLVTFIMDNKDNFEGTFKFYLIISYLKSIIAICPMDLRADIYTNINNLIIKKTGDNTKSNKYFKYLVWEIDEIENDYIESIQNLSLHK